MLFELVKAFIVGFCVPIPAGPVLLLVLQKTLLYGRGAGIAAGIGSDLADTAYAAVGLFALSLVSVFVSGHEALISIVGGLIILLVGYLMSRKDTSSIDGPKRERYTAVGFTFQAAGLAVSNPGALAAMMAALAIAGLEAGSLAAPVWAVLLCVAGGEFCYWFLLTWLVSRFINVTPSRLQKASMVSGMVIAVLGVALFIRGLILLF